MTSVARAFRLDAASWREMAAGGTLRSAGLLVLGTYLLLAFDRFGSQGFFEPRATVRVMLTGFYGWIGLATGAWVIARFAFRKGGRITPVLRTVGYAHMPLLVVGILIQFFSGLFDLGTLSLVVVGVGMPVLLVLAVGASLELDWTGAATAALAPYVAWVLLVGRYLWDQLAHLL